MHFITLLVLFVVNPQYPGMTTMTLLQDFKSLNECKNFMEAKINEATPEFQKEAQKRLACIQVVEQKKALTS